MTFRNRISSAALVMVSFAVLASAQTPPKPPEPKHSIDQFLKMSAELQVDLYEKIVKIRIGQLRQHDPSLADKAHDYFLIAAKDGEIPSGFDEFRTTLYGIKHPEITHADKKGYFPDTTMVEDLLTQIMVNDVNAWRNTPKK